MKKYKFFLFIGLFIVILTPLSSKYTNGSSNGRLWEINYDECFSCGVCAEICDQVVMDIDFPRFVNGTKIGNSHYLLEYTPDADEFLLEALRCCPSGAFKVDNF